MFLADFSSDLKVALNFPSFSDRRSSKVTDRESQYPISEIR